MVAVTHVPRAPQFVEGVINLRGQRRGSSRGGLSRKTPRPAETSPA